MKTYRLVLLISLFCNSFICFNQTSGIDFSMSYYSMNLKPKYDYRFYDPKLFRLSGIGMAGGIDFFKQRNKFRITAGLKMGLGIVQSKSWVYYNQGLLSGDSINVSNSLYKQNSNIHLLFGKTFLSDRKVRIHFFSGITYQLGRYSIKDTEFWAAGEKYLQLFKEVVKIANQEKFYISNGIQFEGIFKRKNFRYTGIIWTLSLDQSYNYKKLNFKFINLTVARRFENKRVKIANYKTLYNEEN